MLSILGNLRSGRTLISFVLYCITHSELRFWQALSGWSGYKIIADTPGIDQSDTFYWEARNGNYN
jgi:hypothetical protein